jgi:hypothetical protein
MCVLRLCATLESILLQLSAKVFKMVSLHILLRCGPVYHQHLGDVSAELTNPPNCNGVGFST